MREELDDYLVYKHISPSGKVYVGITNNYQRRCYEHRYDANSRKSALPFHNAIRKYGWDSFKHEIIIEGVTKEEALRLEAIFIRELDSLIPAGYNILAASDGIACSQSMRDVRIAKRKDSFKGYSYHIGSDNYQILLSVLGTMYYFGSFSLESEAKAKADYLLTLDAEGLLEEFESLKANREDKVKGYYFDKKSGKYRVKLKVNGKGKSFGFTTTEQEAIELVSEVKNNLNKEGHYEGRN